MKEMTFLNKIFFVIVLFFTISLPLPVAFSSIATILLVILFLVNIKDLGLNIKNYAKNSRNFLLLIIFITLAFSVFYSDDKKTAAKGILAALPLVALPLSLSGLAFLTTRHYRILKIVFVISCFAASVFYFFGALFRSGLLDGSYPRYMHNMPLSDKFAYIVIHLTYHHLSPGVHAVFFSLYIAFAIILIIFNWQRLPNWAKTICGFLILYFVLYLILLSSIIINFGLFSYLIGCMYFQFSFRKWHHYLLYQITLLFGAFVILYLLISKSYTAPEIAAYRFDSPEFNKIIAVILIGIFLAGLLSVLIKILFKKNYLPILAGLLILSVLSIHFFAFSIYKIDNQQSNNSITARINYGREALKVIKANSLLGIGIGDKKNANIMKTEDLPPGAKPEHVFNSHNQFLDLWLAAGIIPVICFVLYLANVFRQAVKQKNIVYIALTYCFSLFCFTDAAMMVQRGQVFFLFFVCLFEFESKKKN